MGLKIEIPVAELARTRRLFIATPMYGGMCYGMYTRSMMELTNLLTKMQIEHQPYFLFNESLITRARNYCADEFMRSECTHLLFIDSDIGFSAHDIIALLTLQDDNSEYDVIGAPYPKKTIAWEKIVHAVNKGFGAKDPEELNKFIGDYVFNPKHGTERIPLGAPVEVLEIGTGYMMIRKSTFKAMNKKFPELMYRPDHVRSEFFDGSREIMMYFQADIDPRSKRYLSEDYWFCQKIQELGLKTFLCPWMKTQHCGSFVFGGSLIDLAQLGVPPTADPGTMEKIKKDRKEMQTKGAIPPPKRGPAKTKPKAKTRQKKANTSKV